MQSMGRTSIMITPNIIYAGMRVCRGRDWKWDTQDTVNGVQQPGTIKSLAEPSAAWISVEWDGKPGSSAHYRMGAEGCYDLFLWEDDSQTRLFSVSQLKIGDKVTVADTEDQWMKKNDLSFGQVCTVTQIEGTEMRVDHKDWWVSPKHFTRGSGNSTVIRGATINYCNEIAIGELIIVNSYNDSYITSWGLVIDQEVELVEKHSNNTHIRIKGYTPWVKINCFRKKAGGYVPPSLPEGPVIKDGIAEWGACTHIIKTGMEVMVINDTLSSWIKQGGLKIGDIVTINGTGSNTFLVKTPIHGNLSIDRRCFGLPTQGVIGSVFINRKIKITANEHRTSPRAVQVRRATPSVRSAESGSGRAVRS